MNTESRLGDCNILLLENNGQKAGGDRVSSLLSPGGITNSSMEWAVLMVGQPS